MGSFIGEEDIGREGSEGREAGGGGKEGQGRVIGTGSGVIFESYTFVSTKVSCLFSDFISYDFSDFFSFSPFFDSSSFFSTLF